MKRVRTAREGGVVHHHYDNGLVERPYEGRKNVNWWHENRPNVRCSYIWLPTESCWRWVIHYMGGTSIVAHYPPEQFDIAIAHMLLVP